MDSQVLIKYFWIVLALAVVSIFYYKIDSFRQEDNIVKNFEIDFYVRDIALLVDRMIVTPGNIVVEYPIRNGYNIQISGNSLILKYKENNVNYGLIGDPSKIVIKNDKGKVILMKNE